MRICYVVHSVSHFAAPYVQYFAAQGHDVHVISFTHAPVPEATNHHPFADEHDGRRGNLSYVRAIPTIRRLVRRIAPDLLHAHFLTSNGLVAAASGFRPFVVSARGSDVHNSLRHPLRRQLIRAVMRRADLVNPVSRELATLVEGLGIPASRILCLTQGIDLTRFPDAVRARRAEGPVRLICTRKLQPPYEPATIVEALADVVRDGVDLQCTFAAGGTDEQAVRAQVRAAGLDQRVTFLGGYRPEALPGLLADADVYVSASRWDGTSPALLEAMAAGVYPIVTDTPANREWLGEEGARLFEAGSSAALGRQLRAALVERAAWAGACERNRRVVVERADREANMRLLATHYRRLTGGPV